MLTRIYADNFRALVNFELRPGPLSLFLGGNGSGKSSVFEVVGRLADLVVRGSQVSDSFGYTTTAWESRTLQRFELDIEGGPAGQEGKYRYQVEIKHPPAAGALPIIHSEEVTFEGRTIYRYSGGSVHLFRQDGTPLSDFPFRGEQSFLFSLNSPSGSELGWLKAYLLGIAIVQPNPFALDSGSKRDEAFLNRFGKNLASFFNHLNTERPEARARLEEALRAAMPGFKQMRFERLGDTLLLLAKFEHGPRVTCEHALLDLSEGQRVLTILYTALHGLLGRASLLCFDEPDNFVALSEIQPWLQALGDLVASTGGQAMVISHHPEVIDYLAPEALWRFERPTGPVVARSMAGESTNGVKLSEVMVRGG
jgi:predicted ATPase